MDNFKNKMVLLEVNKSMYEIEGLNAIENAFFRDRIVFYSKTKFNNSFIYSKCNPTYDNPVNISEKVIDSIDLIIERTERMEEFKETLYTFAYDQIAWKLDYDTGKQRPFNEKYIERFLVKNIDNYSNFNDFLLKLESIDIDSIVNKHSQEFTNMLESIKGK